MEKTIAHAASPLLPIRQLAITSNNPKKAAELERCFRSSGLQIEILPRSLPFEVPEPAATFEANAYLKASACARSLQLPALADDSGLACALWNYRLPGPYSARFSLISFTASGIVISMQDQKPAREVLDRDNNRRMLEEIRTVSREHRRVKYVCVISIALPDGTEVASERGEWEGTLSEHPRGDRGFGYDPIVIPDSHRDRTVAELSDAEKDAVSHRAIAIRNLIASLRSIIPNR